MQPIPLATMESRWFKNAVIYCLDVDTFKDGNGDGVGDFIGLQQGLSYLAGLGVTCVWLLPFYPSPGRDNGYDITDYLNVHPALGDLQPRERFERNPRQKPCEQILTHVEAPLRGCKPKPPKIPTPQLQLPSAIAQVGGKKELTGRIDIEIEISNPCARLIANVTIYYNSAILSRLLTKEASGNVKALALIKKMSPAAWRHIHLNGHYTFRGDGQLIDLDAIVAGLQLG